MKLNTYCGKRDDHANETREQQRRWETRQNAVDDCFDNL